MAEAPRYVAFLDESGDYVLDGFDQGFPVFAVCALTCTLDQYLKSVSPALNRVKYRFWRTECVVFHGHRIRSKKSPFAILKDADVHSEFMEAVTSAFADCEAVLIAAAIHKGRHQAQYVDPANPFFLSLQFVLERLAMHWGRRLNDRERLLCVFEKRGADEDRRTKEWFERICAGENHRGHIFHFECDFRGKDENVVGHQFADLAAYTVARFAESQDEKRKDWRAIRGKIRNSWSGQIDGYGLKIFPPAPKS